MGRAAGAQVHELPLALDTAEDRRSRPGGIRVEARLVGEQPAADEARARDPRFARPADRRRRVRRRVLAVPAAALAWQHNRSRDERDSAQHRGRARARDAEEQVVDFSFTPEQDDLRREARSFLDAAVLFEELGRALYDGPFVLNEVAGQPGDDVWSIEIDGFVPHLAQVQRVLTPAMESAVAAGEPIATVDETLRLGRLSRNGVERAEGDWLEVRRRVLAALALEAVGIGSK